MRRSTALKAAAALLVLLSLAAAYLSIMSYWEGREEAHIHGMFMEYKARCNKTYNSTAGEEEYRCAVFKENFRRGDNVLVCIFGDMTREELHAWQPGELPDEDDGLADQKLVLPLMEGGVADEVELFQLLRQIKSEGSTIHGEMKHRWT